jgi:hypothetical protein
MQEGLCESGKVVCDVVVHGLQASMTELVGGCSSGGRRALQCRSAMVPVASLVTPIVSL